MQNQFSRTQLLFGKPAIETLSGSRVAVFGVGGVGGYVVEVLARSGVGELDLFDDDRVCLTNVNRQIHALISTVGKHKVDVAADRIHDINPRCIVHRYEMFYMPSNADDINLALFDYVVDCVDTVTAKLELIKRCHALHIPIISCMGAANKLDPTAFRVADINKTKMDPLAKVVRKKLRKLHIPHLKVIYSEEEPYRPIDDPDISCRFHCICPNKDMRKCTERRDIPASNAFVPAAAGLIAGGEVVKDLIRNAHTMRLLPEEAKTNEYALKAAATAEAHLKKYHKILMAKKNGTWVDDKVIKTLESSGIKK
jgi:tRNA A37 threonylcarbamoyladenosine dehydratase